MVHFAFVWEAIQRWRAVEFVISQLRKWRAGSGPRLVLRFPEPNLRQADKRHWMYLHNPGNSPAHNVQVVPVEGGLYRAEFDRIDAIPPLVEAPVIPTMTLLNPATGIRAGHNIFGHHIEWFRELLAGGEPVAPGPFQDRDTRLNWTLETEDGTTQAQGCVIRYGINGRVEVRPLVEARRRAAG